MKTAENAEFKTDYKHYYAIAIRLVSLLAVAIHLVVNKEDTFSHMLSHAMITMAKP